MNVRTGIQMRRKDGKGEARLSLCQNSHDFSVTTFLLLLSFTDSQGETIRKPYFYIFEKQHSSKIRRSAFKDHMF